MTMVSRIQLYVFSSVHNLEGGGGVAEKSPEELCSSTVHLGAQMEGQRSLHQVLNLLRAKLWQNTIRTGR